MNGKWKILIPVLVVLAVAVFAYMRTAPKLQDQKPEGAAMMEDSTGEPTGDTEVDALVDEILDAADAEAEAAAAVEQEGDVAAGAEGDNELFNGEYYEE